MLLFVFGTRLRKFAWFMHVPFVSRITQAKTMLCMVPRLILFGEFLVDTGKAELYYRGERVPLQGKPFELLLALLDHAGQVVSREALIEQLWRAGTRDRRRSLQTAVKKVRVALGTSSSIAIETVSGHGYRLACGAGPVILSGNRLAPDAAVREILHNNSRAAS